MFNKDQKTIGLLLYSLALKELSFMVTRNTHIATGATYVASTCSIYNMLYIAFSVEPSLLSSWLPLVLIPSVAAVYRKVDNYIFDSYSQRIFSLIDKIRNGKEISDDDKSLIERETEFAGKVLSENRQPIATHPTYPVAVSRINTAVAVLITRYSFAPILNMSPFWITKWLCTDSQSSRQRLFESQKGKISELNDKFKHVSLDSNLWNLNHDFYLQYMVVTFNVEKLAAKYTQNGIGVYRHIIKKLFTAACLKTDGVYIISDNQKKLTILFKDDAAVGKLVEKFNTVLANKIGEEQANIKAGNIGTAGAFITVALKAVGVDIPNSKVSMIGEGYGSCTVSVTGLSENKRDLLLACVQKHFPNGNASFNCNNLVVQGEMQKTKDWRGSIDVLKKAIADIGKSTANFFVQPREETEEISWGDHVFSSGDKNCKIFELKDQQGGERIFVLFDVDNVDTAELKRRFNGKNKPKIESIKSNNGYTRQITVGRNGNEKIIYGKKCDQDKRNCKLFIYDTTDPSVTKLPTPS